MTVGSENLKKEKKTDRFRALINALLLPFRTSKFQFSHEQSTILTSTMKLIYSSRLCFNIMGWWPEELTGLRPFQMLTASPSAAGHWYTVYLRLLLQPVLPPLIPGIWPRFFESSQVSFIHFAFFRARKDMCAIVVAICAKGSWVPFKQLVEKVVPAAEEVIWGTRWSPSLRSSLIPPQLFLILTRCDAGFAPAVY